MGDRIELTLQERAVSGKAVKNLRKQGLVPAVVYGQDFEAQNVMAPHLDVAKVCRIAGKRQPVELTIGKQKRLAMIKSIDLDPVKYSLRHVAFNVVKQGETVETGVPITIVGAGETPAEKAGLVILTTVDKAEIEALPTNLPERLEAPGEKLVAEGDHLKISDLVVPDGVKIKSDPDQIVATVYEPAALEAANEATGGSAEPEEEAAETEESTEESEAKPEDENSKK